MTKLFISAEVAAAEANAARVALNKANNDYAAKALATLRASFAPTSNAVSRDLQSFIENAVKQIEERIAFQTEKNAPQEQHEAFKKTVQNETVARLMLDCNLDVSFINKSERKDSRFNVYSAAKVFNVAESAATQSVALNTYTRAILKTAMSLESNDCYLTQLDAQLASSADSSSSDKKRLAMIVKTPKCYSRATADSQASSSVNALQRYGVLVSARDASGKEVFKLNRANRAFAMLSSIL